ncbi:TonB-dependent receptor [Marinobacterium lacunae]|uniref:TonB-dependent receptor n=1 Tax=Marinobacterium lacunae TaxID=1232683 RepID=A0A081G1D1_9GAMM|nr:TonB-dependent receptor [Marinobacterium lacunae]KEA64586.1 TonB-dependent receptor [Marinobacterium lacunae]
MNRTDLRLLTLFCLLVPVAQPLCAEGLLDEADFFIDIPEVTSATRMPQKISEAPASLTVIDRKMIEASGLQTIPDLMRLVPGFQTYLVNSNSYGTTYHGASDDYPNRLEVMVDGRSVYLPLLSTVIWESLSINLDDIERIEVVRGSNVPTQGSNAFLGSINIITREPTASSGINLSTLFGSQDTRNAHMSYADSNGVFSYRLSASHEQNDGNDHYSEFYTGDWFAADGSDGKWQDDLSRDYLNISTTWTPDLINSFWFQFGVDRGAATTGALDVESPHFAKRHHDSSFQSVKFNRLYSDHGTLQLSAYHNALELSTPSATIDEVLTDFEIPVGSPIWLPFFAAPIPADEVPDYVQALIEANAYHLIEQDGKAETTDLELQITDRIGRADIVAGMGYRYMSADSEILLQGGGVDEERSRAFGTVNFNLTDRWQLVSGVMYEYSSESTEGFSYRNAVIFKPNNGRSFRLGYSSSERLPSLLERYGESGIVFPAYAPYVSDTVLYDYNSSPNPDLEEESISSWELGFYQALPAQKGYVDLRLFNEHVNNAIFSYYETYTDELDSRQRVRLNKNIGNWRNEGAELQIKYQPTNDLWAVLSYSYINTLYNEFRTGDVGTRKELFDHEDTMTPEHTASLLIGWSPVPDLQLSATHFYMDSVKWIEGGYREAYNRTDLRAAKQWHLDNGSELETALIIQNAFGPAYEEFYRYNEFDRRTYLQLKLKFD